MRPPFHAAPGRQRSWPPTGATCPTRLSEPGLIECLSMADPRNDRATSVWHLLVGPAAVGAGHGQGTDHSGRGTLRALARRAHVGGLRARGHHPRAGGGGRGRPAPRPAHHDRHRRPPGHPRLLLPPGHRRLPDGRRGLRRRRAPTSGRTPASSPPRRWSSTTRSPSPSPLPPASPRCSPPSPPSTGPPSRSAWGSSSSSPCSTSAAWERRRGPSCCPPWCSSSGCWPSS